jgi:hypothetical protein
MKRPRLLKILAVLVVVLIFLMGSYSNALGLSGLVAFGLFFCAFFGTMSVSTIVKAAKRSAGWKYLGTIVTTAVLTQIGILGFLAVCIATEMASVWPHAMADWRLPLGELQDVVVDSEGRIYCDSAYSRVQVYSPAGEFLRGWFVEAYGGPFRLYIDNGYLDVVTYRGNEHYTYTPDGELVSHERLTVKEQDDLTKKKSGVSTGPGGTRYRCHRSVLWPYVTKTTTNGQTERVVTDPWPLRLISGPLPAFIYALTGLPMTGVFAEIESKGRKKRPEAARGS